MIDLKYHILGVKRYSRAAVGRGMDAQKVTPSDNLQRLIAEQFTLRRKLTVDCYQTWDKNVLLVKLLAPAATIMRRILVTQIAEQMDVGHTLN